MFLYIDCLKGMENLVVSVSSQGKQTWTAVLESASSCASAWARDTNTIKLPPKTGTRPDPSPAAYRGTWMPTGERRPALGRLSWPRDISGNPHNRPRCPSGAAPSSQQLSSAKKQRHQKERNTSLRSFFVLFCFVFKAEDWQTFI